MFDFFKNLFSSPLPQRVITDRIPSAMLLSPKGESAGPATFYGDMPVALQRGVGIRFELQSDIAQIRGLRLRIGTYCRTNRCHLSVCIGDFVHRVSAESFKDNEYAMIEFPAPLLCDPRHKLEVLVYSADASDKHMVALWCTRQVPPFITNIGDIPVLQTVERPKVSLVIPVFNKAIYTYNCLRTVAACDLDVPKEVIIVDNASQDETPHFLAHLGDGFNVIRNSDNKGFVEACRQGADEARGDFILFLNNDTQVMPGWLENMLEQMDSVPSIGITGSKLVYPDGRLQEAGGIIFNDASGWNYGRLQDRSDPRFNRSREVDYCSGAALMIRRELWDKLGGFDMRYAPAYYEDTDLCFAARAAGYKVYYCHDSEVIHHEGITAGTDIDSGYKAYQKINHEKFFNKWRVVLEEHLPPPPQSSPEQAAFRLEERSGNVG